MSEFVQQLPAPVREIVEPLFTELPLETAMAHLVPSQERVASELVLQIADKLALWPNLVAGVFLLVDALDQSHSVSQENSSWEGSYWHGMMHRREGDFSNAKYWFRMAGSLPSRLELDPFALTDEVARHHRDNPIHLVEAQRQEWCTLFLHCARQIE